MWMVIAITATIIAVGNILFGHFEEKTPKWRRVLKTLFMLCLMGVISTWAGIGWACGLLGLMFIGVLVIHGWWLPSKGINGWTGEPKDKYYELRGWAKGAAAGAKENE